MTRSIRKGSIPANLILFTLQTSAPSKFVVDSNSDLMPRNTSSGTNPNSNVTTSSHQHATSGTHTHNGSYSHKHGAQTATYTGSDGSGSYLGSAGIHHHAYESNATSASVTTVAGGDHQHAATAVADPPFYTYLQIKKSSVYNMRTSHQVPHKACALWASTNTVPSGYTIESLGNDKFLKTTATPNQTGGEATHTHAEVAGHTHSFTIPSHTHVLPSATGSGSNDSARIGSGSATVTPGSGHTHDLDNVSWSSETVTDTTGTSAAHSDTAVARDPAWFKTSIIRRDIIKMRNNGVPKSSIVMWKETLATIPSGFALTDGNNGTTNYLDKFVKITGSSSGAGSTGGSDTHQHAAQSHTHTLTAHHTHTISGDTEQAGGGSPASAGGVTGTRMNEHTHGPGFVTDTTWTTTETAAHSHQHAAASSLPSYKRVAYIQKTS